MIVICGGIKGGSGKTTLATNLAVMRANSSKVLLVDGDEQKSTSDWAEQRDALGIKTNWSTIQLSGRSMHSELEKLKKHYDDIIVDVGGRNTTSLRSSLVVADVFIVPFRPRSLDVWTLAGIKTLISEIKISNPKLKSFALINQADAKGTDNSEAESVLSECPDLECFQFHIGQRKSFANAASEGLGVIELKNVDRKAVQELTSLYEALYKSNIKLI